MPCEDAPCCGCCGLGPWQREDDAMYESLDDDFYAELERSYDDGDPDFEGADKLERRDSNYRGWA